MRIPKLQITSTDRLPIVTGDLPANYDVWQAPDGSPLATAHFVNKTLVVEAPDLARFSYTLDAWVVRAEARSAVAVEHVSDFYHRHILPVVLDLAGLTVLHASAVLTDAGVIAFCGVSHAGKSTLAHAFSRQRCAIWADDAVAIFPQPNGLMSIALPFQLRMRPAALAYWQEDLLLQRHVSPGETCQLAALFCLEPDRNNLRQGICIRKLNGKAAVATIMPHVYVASLATTQQKQVFFTKIIDLLASAPFYEIQFDLDFGQLPDLVKAIRHHVPQSPARC